jgi:hypothetical protein
MQVLYHFFYRSRKLCDTVEILTRHSERKRHSEERK